MVPLRCWWRFSAGWELALICLHVSMLWKVALLSAASRRHVVGMIGQETSCLKNRGGFIFISYNSKSFAWKIKKMIQILDEVVHQVSGVCSDLKILEHQNFVCKQWNKQTCFITPRRVTSLCLAATAQCHHTGAKANNVSMRRTN